MSDRNEQTTTGAVAQFAGSAFKKRKKKKKRKKTPLAFTRSGISVPVGYEDTTNGSMSQFGGHPPYSQKGRKKAKMRLGQAVEEAVDLFVERALQPGPGRKGRKGKELRGFLKKRGLLGIPRQRMK